MHVLWQCESDPYCRAVLRKHWTDIPCYEDVKTLLADAGHERRGTHIAREGGGSNGRWQVSDGSLISGSERSDPATVDVLAGGFPCQPVSVAGRRQGTADERWLWPEFARLIRLLRPRYALMENVPGLLAPWQSDDGRWNPAPIEEVVGDLAECGYDAEWASIPAAAVGAPHLRYRVFIVAYPSGDQLRLQQGRGGPERPSGLVEERPQAPLPGVDGEAWSVADTDSIERNGRPGIFGRGWQGEFAHNGQWTTEPDVGRVANGVPSRVDRLRALGNAVVPQVAEAVGRMIVVHAEGQRGVGYGN
jgi:DNA (cytosine-5)-methyltransferase 1